MPRLAAIDVGTNSIRMLVVNIDPENYSFSVISDRKQVVRLGEGEYAHNRMTDEAMDRAITVIKLFAEVARGFDTDEIVATTTSAVREADNQQDFLERVRRESGLELQVISGLEEARLVYLGVASGSTLSGKRALFIDVGGGSTELIVGDRQQHYHLESLKLGTIRLTNRFFGDGHAAVSKKKYALLQEYIRGVAVHAARKARNVGFEMAIGSSGTMINLGEMVSALRGDNLNFIRQYPVPLKDLIRVREMLCKAPLEERRKLPGIKPERADIMIAGVAVLETLAEILEVEEIHVSESGLREGLVVDWILKDQEARHLYRAVSPRKRSVLQLARACNYEIGHCEQVRMMALSLFDQLWELGLHRMDRHARELLEYSAYLHDVGFFISHTNHHHHAYYIIRHSELLGFNDREQAILANLALYHRKSVPKKKHGNFSELDSEARELVEKLAAILRICEGLDRSHLSLVKDLKLSLSPENMLTMTLVSDTDCQLEIWGVESQIPVFEQVYGVKLKVAVMRPSAPEDRGPEESDDSMGQAAAG